MRWTWGWAGTYAEQENAEDEDKSKPEEPAQVKRVQAIQNALKWESCVWQLQVI